LKAIGEEYIHSVLRPISTRFNWSYEIIDIDVVEEPGSPRPLRFVKSKLELDIIIALETYTTTLSPTP